MQEKKELLDWCMHVCVCLQKNGKILDSTCADSDITETESSIKGSLQE